VIQIEKMESSKPLNSYAPSWNVPFGLTTWEDEAGIDTVTSFLLEKENEILLSTKPHSDGGTGLGIESLTARFGSYNLFDLGEEEPKINELKKFIQKSYIEFVEQDETPIEDLQIVCWYNIIRKGQKIDPHSHGASPITYLSGNIHLGNYNTKTFYKFPYEDIEMHFQNKKGQLTLFPGYIQHRSDEYTEDGIRLSIAFDLWTQEHGTPSSKPKKTVTFMNKDIADEIRSS